MTRISYVLATVALVLLLSGCSVGPVDDTSSPTVSATAATAIDDFDYPRGIDESGVNASLVAEGHEKALSRTNFTLRSSTEVDTPDRRRAGRLVLTAETGLAPVLVEHTLEHGSGTEHANETTNTYATEETVYRQTGIGREPAYSVSERSRSPSDVFPESYAGTWFVRSHLSSAEFTPERVTNRSGVPVVVLTASLSDVNERDGRNVTSFDATATVDRRGVVRSMSVDTTFVEEGETVTYSERFAVTDVGSTTVAEPSWVDTARARDTRSESRSTPRGNVTRSLTDERLGAVVTATGRPEAIDRLRISRWDHAFRDSETVRNASVSSFVEVIGDGRVERGTVTIAYDESSVPNGNESGLAVYRYNKSLQTFFRLNSTVDATDDTVTATTSRLLEDGEYGNSSAYVVFYAQTWRDLWNGNPPSK